MNRRCSIRRSFRLLYGGHALIAGLGMACSHASEAEAVAAMLLATNGVTAYRIHAHDPYVSDIYGIGPRVTLGDAWQATDLYLAAELYDLKPDGEVALTIKHAYGVMFGVSHRRYLIENTGWMAPFLGIGLGSGTLTYEYRDEVLDVDRKRVRSDSLRFFQGDLHMGLQVLRAGGCAIQAHAGLVARVYGSETEHGIANDAMAANLGYVTSIGLGFSF